MEEVVGVRARAFTAVALTVAACAWGIDASEVMVSYLGHSCFSIQAEDGPVILIDPYATYVPYPGLPVSADIVLMTHQHIDHCPWCFGEADRVEGDPILIHLWDSTGRCREKIPPASWVITPEFRMHAIEASHVTQSGGGQGWVCMLSFEVGGIRFAHLADLGRVLTADQISALRDIDVLLLPVGGAYTIGPAEAMTVIGQLSSVRVVLPMHYFVAGLTPWPDMAPLEDFTVLAGTTYPVREIGDYAVSLDGEELPDSVEIWVLAYKPD